MLENRFYFPSSVSIIPIARSFSFYFLFCSIVVRYNLIEPIKTGYRESEQTRSVDFEIQMIIIIDSSVHAVCVCVIGPEKSKSQSKNKGFYPHRAAQMRNHSEAESKQFTIKPA